jgi:hypothetical protein
MKSPRTLRLLSQALLLALTAACASTTAAVETKPEWLEPSPRLRAQIEDAAKRLPWTHGMERVEMITWFASVGEPAYPTLLAMVLDPRKDVAGSALASLGATRDSRLVEPMRALPWPEGQDTDLLFERARALMRLGDWQMVPILIGGLRNEELLTRALCAQTLWESTHERFAYDPKAEPDEREKSIVQWEKWWHERNEDPLQSGRGIPAGAAVPASKSAGGNGNGG